MSGFSRRQFLKYTVSVGLGVGMGSATGLQSIKSTESIAEDSLHGEQPGPHIKLAMLHLNPQLGELDSNCALLEQAMRSAAAQGAQWLVTPELALTGYRFDTVLDDQWITAGPDQWVRHLQGVAAELGVHLFLGHLEQDARSGNTYNTAFVINQQGEIVGRHRKINTIAVSEDWSTPGEQAIPINIGGWQVGLLICADAWRAEHAKNLQLQGADLIISPANWPPGQYGPGDCWEQRSLETGMPLMVCNRTGVERQFDMRAAESVLVSAGQRLVSHSSDESSILFINWNQRSKKLLRHWSIPVDSAPIERVVND